MKTDTDKAYEIAKRAKELANMPMAVLRRFVESPMVSGKETRGDLIEIQLIEEFCK